MVSTSGAPIAIVGTIRVTSAATMNTRPLGVRKRVIAYAAGTARTRESTVEMHCGDDAVDQRRHHALAAERGDVVLQRPLLRPDGGRHGDRVERSLERGQQQVDERESVQDEGSGEQRPEDDAGLPAGLEGIHRVLLPGRQMRVMAVIATASMTIEVDGAHRARQAGVAEAGHGAVDEQAQRGGAALRSAVGLDQDDVERAGGVDAANDQRDRDHRSQQRDDDAEQHARVSWRRRSALPR